MSPQVAVVGAGKVAARSGRSLPAVVSPSWRWGGIARRPALTCDRQIRIHEVALGSRVAETAFYVPARAGEPRPHDRGATRPLRPGG